MVTAYVWATYWNNPVYQAAEQYDAALVLLGVDDGRKCSERELTQAMGMVLEAARLVPGEPALAQHVERLRWRFEERHFKLPLDLARHAEIVSAATRRVEESKQGWLPIGAHDRGWAATQLLAGPRRAALWSTPGVVLILLVWAWGRFGARAVREREHEAQLKQVEQEVAALEAARTRDPARPRRAANPAPAATTKKRPPPAG
jgi:hypothetical protein